MSILSDRDIARIVNRKDLVIYPLAKSSITGLGYDLRIGCIQPLKRLERFSRDNGKVVIPPGGYCVVITKEFVWLSNSLVGTLHARGTLAAKGLFTNATNVDPNFRGQMIMSVVNSSDIDIELKDDEPFITLILHEVRSPTRTLVGQEGTKNSMRVTNQMASELYTNPKNADQLARVRQLHEYFVHAAHTDSPVFERLVHEALRYNWWRALVDAFKFGRQTYDRSLKEYVINGLTLACYGLIAYSLFRLILDVRSSGVRASREDWRAFLVAGAAVFVFMEKLRKK